MPEYNNAQMRRWVTDFFEDEENFDFFIEDNYPDIFQQFESGMSQNRKARLLTKHCEDTGSYDQLIDLLQNEDPDRFAALPPPEPQAGTTVEPTPAPPPSEEPSPPEFSAAPASALEKLPDAPARADVFISYSRRDSDFVAQLYQELTGRGISAWFDKENIQVADHWRTSIVEGVRDCEVFILVLSPDSTGSVNVRKEVDLAERYDKQIIPLMWRETDIPVAMEYQLAGIQWIDFTESASPENFRELAEVLNSLIGGATLAEAASNKQVAKNSTIDVEALEKDVPAQTEAGRKIGGGRKLGGLKKKQSVTPMAVGGSVISSVVTTLGLEAGDQDFVNGELKWLFGAASNFMKIRRGEIERTEPIKIKIPPDAEGASQADNTLLDSIDDFDLQIWEGQIESALKRIDTHLRNLNILLDQEAKKGDAGKGDVYLQNQIKGGRLEIIKILQEMAQLMSQAYGIRVTSPEQLVAFVGG